MRGREEVPDMRWGNCRLGGDVGFLDGGWRHRYGRQCDRLTGEEPLPAAVEQHQPDGGGLEQCLQRVFLARCGQWRH
jgi:hypothetical protein